MITVSRDSREPPFRDPARDVTRSKISPHGEMIQDEGLDTFGPLQSVIPYVLCVKSLLSGIGSGSPYRC